MKRLSAFLLLATSLVCAMPSYAVTCSVMGPRGGTWSASGVTTGAAVANARALCRTNSGGPCTFIPGSCR